MIKTICDKNDFDKVFKRSRTDYENMREGVKRIIEAVKTNGDKALFEYTEKFDNLKITPQTVLVSEAEIEKAYKDVDVNTLEALRSAKNNIYEYNKRHIRHNKINCENGITTGYIVKPVTRAGIYVPGGKAAYPSTVLMCAIPAAVAGVKEIIMTTPGANTNPLTLVAARECGVNKIFKIGGAQAIAAMAYGTKSVPKVDVISGPGNIYVALAKREVYGEVGIDMVAGPSEILIVADESANADFIAADMLSQAEHDEMATSILITTNKELAESVKKRLCERLDKLSRRSIAEKSIDNYGAIVIVDSVDEGIALANKVAPEHLELCVKDAENHLRGIENAGAVFIGNYSPEPLGDYYAGPNHVLPTGGTARYASSLGVDNYIKKISVISYDENALRKVGKTIETLANAEGLTAHAEAIGVRIRK
ncbi:MAG: histidinol dehydrogenase [Clostridia bacterium]|nr:histidinol dehydrogenase [Clostridia bacterium]